MFKIIMLNHTIPSLQGTLAKRTKPTLQPNFAKEPFRPSRSKAGLGYHANLKSNQINMNNNRQCLTANILQRGDLGIHPALHLRSSFFIDG